MIEQKILVRLSFNGKTQRKYGEGFKKRLKYQHNKISSKSTPKNGEHIFKKCVEKFARDQYFASDAHFLTTIALVNSQKRSMNTKLLSSFCFSVFLKAPLFLFHIHSNMFTHKDRSSNTLLWAVKMTVPPKQLKYYGLYEYPTFFMENFGWSVFLYLMENSGRRVSVYWRTFIFSSV